jgi:hypothetical protein
MRPRYGDDICQVVNSKIGKSVRMDNPTKLKQYAPDPNKPIT